ncbi:MAG: PAS domain S-box protein [Dehalococcoidia bacterium]
MSAEATVDKRERPLPVLKDPHFWVIVTIMSCGTILYYADYLPVISGIESGLRLDFARHSVHRILSILPVAYAAFVFGLPGGLTATAVIAALLLPRVFIAPAEAGESAVEVAAFVFIGGFVSWLIDVQSREKSQHRETISSLEWTQRELRSHIQALENEQRRLSAINAVLSAAAASLELPEILNLAMDKVRGAMGVEISMLYLLDEEATVLSLEAYRGISSEYVQVAEKINVGEGLNGRVAQTGEPLAVTDSSSSPVAQTDMGKKENIQAQVIVPIKAKGEVVGTLGVATRGTKDFAPEEVALLSAIGNAVGVAIDNARLYQKERQISQLLRQSEQNYRGLFENSTEAIFIHGFNGKIIGANRACEKLTGYTSSEMTGMEIGSFLSDQGGEAIAEIVAKQYEGESSGSSYELRLTKRDGTEAIVEMTPSAIIRDEKPVGVQVILRDVTEQRRMQENMRFYLSQVLKAQESERLRIARELHDDTAQALVGLSRRLDMLASGEETSMPPDTLKKLDELREQTDAILASVRRFSQDLRPPVLDDLGLLPALKWLAVALEEQDRISSNIRLLGDQRRLPRDVELTLFRIAQEALSNVRKHSRASAVELTLDFRDSIISMTVADNGKGFSVPQTTSDLAALGKLGVIGMQERARLLGGSLTVESKPDEGTRIVVSAPG